MTTAILDELKFSSFQQHFQTKWSQFEDSHRSNFQEKLEKQEKNLKFKVYLEVILKRYLNEGIVNQILDTLTLCIKHQDFTYSSSFYGKCKDAVIREIAKGVFAIYRLNVMNQKNQKTAVNKFKKMNHDIVKNIVNDLSLLSY